ncbi:tRNA (adenosine(37)-N6)-threonylcarbamoyltransferase complex transferase subunit TsaD [Jiulongibacter sediminis]|uniref:tRNA (adenosine(37)-N6)-threonylcarbamoyltransferase complex transferase subunit TsaD n=1 Tax=Jiulongibacter sediminis TaxID=1605367 RepID=UPI0026E929E7|nr:tRNA (adenosine(37)-N6)-threonylcarbamoyltransferase complex transferase subunit TsaD [Jiulongibacter sediminis]
MPQNQVILAIESSCDETSASVIINGEVKSNIVSTQVIHEKYGGVVPELASRAHQQHILPVVETALKQAKVTKNDVAAVAFTRGPGLLGSLLVGTSFAKSFALALNIPLIEVNHVQAHILAHFIDEPKPQFPFICLTVSGGHTQLVLVKSPLKMEIIGETKDDAVGEAFDKAAKMLGLPYPGGPMIDKYASEGNSEAFEFPISEMPGFSYSFSGIKTALLYFLQKKVNEDADFIDNNMADICASFQQTLITMLLQKLRKATRQYKVKQIAIAGGVAANSGLRNEIQKLAEKEDLEVFIPQFQYCTDNAAMIAMAAHFKYLEKEFTDQKVSAMPRYALH